MGAVYNVAVINREHHHLLCDSFCFYMKRLHTDPYDLYDTQSNCWLGNSHLNCNMHIFCLLHLKFYVHVDLISATICGLLLAL